MPPVTYSAAPGMVLVGSRRTSGSGILLPAVWFIEQAARRRTTAATPSFFMVGSLHVIEHLLRGRDVAAVRSELDVLLQVRLRLGVLAGADVDHPELVVRRRELV